MKAIKLGVEEEFFILEQVGATIGVSQMQFLKQFSEIYGYRVVAVDDDSGLPLQVNRDFGTGYVSIKFDSTFNILEVAYPPFHDVESALSLILATWDSLYSLAKNHGLELERSGFREANLSDADFFQKSSVRQTIRRPTVQKHFFDRYYPGKICSTQVHLELDTEQTFSRLEQFYYFEPIIPLLFTNSSVDGVAHCFRLLLLQDAFADDYLLFGYPDKIAGDLASYKKLKSTASSCWRDYSLIVPRDFGTWEFRSACIQPNFASLRALLSWRFCLASLILSDKLSVPELAFQSARRAYLQSCIDPNHQVVRAYIDEVLSACTIEKIIEASSSNCIESFLSSKLRAIGDAA